MRILWIDSVGPQVFDAGMLRISNEAKRADTQVDAVSLPGSAIRSQKTPEINERFHQLQEQTQPFRLESQVEVVNGHLTALGRVKKPALRMLDRVGGNLDDARKGERHINFGKLIAPEKGL